MDKNIDERREYLKLLRYDRSLHPEYDLAIQKGFEINYDLEQTKSRLKEVDNYFIKREMIVKHLKDKLLELDNKVKPLKSLSLKGKLSHESKAVQQPAVQQPAVQQPAVQQPAVQQPAVQQPAVQQPAVQQPAVQQPAVQQPDSAFGGDPLTLSGWKNQHLGYLTIHTNSQ